MYCLAPYYEHGERILHAKRGTGTVINHVGAGGSRTCVRFDGGAVRRFKSTHALAPPDPRAHAAAERAAAAASVRSGGSGGSGGSAAGAASLNAEGRPPRKARLFFGRGAASVAPLAAGGDNLSAAAQGDHQRNLHRLSDAALHRVLEARGAALTLPPLPLIFTLLFTLIFTLTLTLNLTPTPTPTPTSTITPSLTLTRRAARCCRSARSPVTSTSKCVAAAAS